MTIQKDIITVWDNGTDKLNLFSGASFSSCFLMFSFDADQTLLEILIPSISI